MTATLAEAAVRDPARPAAQLLLETTVCDLHLTALHIGILTTLLSASTQSGREPRLRPWRHLIFQDSEAMLLALKYCQETELPGSIGLEMVRFYKKLPAAKAKLEPLTTERGDRSAAWRGECESAAREWRQLATEAQALLKTLRTLTQRRLESSFVTDNQTLILFLGEAISGQVQRISPHGEITPLALLQRRTAPRMRTGGACRVIIGNAAFSAEFLDVSRGGVGLRCKAPAEIGQTLDVELSGNRRIGATVVRKDAGGLGLKFDVPLHVDDPLLRATNSNDVRPARQARRCS